jgi:hypothetical protein
VRTTSGLDGHDSFTVSSMSFLIVWRVVRWCGLRREGIVPGQEFTVLACEDVVGHCCYREASSEVFAQGKHERCLPRTDGSGQVSSLSRFPSVRMVGSFRRMSSAYPPIPIVNALSAQSLFSMIGISRPRKLPGPSSISCVCPWSAAAPACECDAPSCE